MLELIKRRIDRIHWYHEFDFGNGLRTEVKTPDAQSHRALWRFIEAELDKIDFTNKAVLDIGCWDGYWSFYSERRGAARVLATDDRSQNWTGSAGFDLAKELFKSSVESNLALSVYDLGKLETKFDIILCLGVFYHLLDPFYAFAQIRHRCHEHSIVVFEGDAFFGLIETPDQSAVLYGRDVRKAPNSFLIRIRCVSSSMPPISKSLLSRFFLCLNLRVRACHREESIGY